MLNKFQIIEDNLESMNNLQLIETLKYLQDNFSILGSVQPGQETESDDTMDAVEKLFLQDRKNELKNRVEILLVKNPDWEEFLQPVLEELGYESVTIDYINDKLKLLEQLEEDNIDTKDYKQEVINLCMYLKSELETGSINLGDKNEILVELINSTLNMVSDESVQKENINWKEQLEILNEKCEEIYNLV